MKRNVAETFTCPVSEGIGRSPFKRLSLFLIFFLCSIIQVSAEIDKDNKDVRNLTIEEFINTAVSNDKVFEEILVSELALKYSKDLKLPSGDLILSVRNQYEFNPDGDGNNMQATVSLSKLFPYSGTGISAEYKTSPSLSSDENSSEITFLISQPVAENAFGKSTVLYDRTIGIETDVATYQIVEAYEDYLAAVMLAYYKWYSAYENLRIGESSYKQSQKLLDNIKNRKGSSIALPIDVNKVNIQVLVKEENLIKLQESYDNILNIIKQAIRYKGDAVLNPVDPFSYRERDILFDKDYEEFTGESRTYKTLNLLENKASLTTRKELNELLPSADLLVGYTMEGSGMSENSTYAGISIIWPFPNSRDRAEYESSKITERKTALSNENKKFQLYTNLKNFYLQIEREKKLMETAEEKIRLAEAIFKDEEKNYSYGKVTLNDYILAVNRVDENRFNKILHAVQLKILMTEWYRITDRLISKKDIKEIPPQK